MWMCPPHHFHVVAMSLSSIYDMFLLFLALLGGEGCGVGGGGRVLTAGAGTAPAADSVSCWSRR
jgi:hypothetical protein